VLVDVKFVLGSSTLYAWDRNLATSKCVSSDYEGQAQCFNIELESEENNGRKQYRLKQPNNDSIFRRKTYSRKFLIPRQSLKKTRNCLRF